MRTSHGLLLVALNVVLAAAALFAGVRLLAPQREEPAIDFAALAVAAARRVEAYGIRHRGFGQLRADSILFDLPRGTGLRVAADSTQATLSILHDGQSRCSIRVAYGEPLGQPRCTELK